MVKKTFIIAEVGLAHEGSLGIAKSFVDNVQINIIKLKSSVYCKRILLT